MAQVRKAASPKRPAAAAALDNAEDEEAGDTMVENNAREKPHKDVPERALKFELSCANVAGLLADVSFPLQAHRDCAAPGAGFRKSRTQVQGLAAWLRKTTCL